jgi:phosphatidylinositol glycan class X
MSYITTNVYPSQGFHPISSNIVYFSAGPSSLVQCSFHLYFKLPPLLFVDPHELAQRNNTYTFNHWGSRDLEKPVHALPETERGSDVLLNVRLPPSIDDDRKSFETGSMSWNVTVDLPMHLRYGVPAPSGKSYVHIQVDSPIAFLLCKTFRELFYFYLFFLAITDTVI